MLQRHYMTLKSTREKHAHREALLARLDTDSELLSRKTELTCITVISWTSIFVELEKYSFEDTSFLIRGQWYYTLNFNMDVAHLILILLHG